MDPLSIAGTAAGLVAFAANLIKTIDSFVSEVKRRPALLEGISEELGLLVSVLQDLLDKHVHDGDKDANALRRVLVGCGQVVHQIHEELAALKTMFQRSRLRKAYAQLTFSSKLAAITSLREQLDKYKSTLLVALSIRSLDNSSPESIHQKLDKLQHDISQAAKTNRRSEWVNPIQQYLDQHSTGASSITLVDKSHATSTSSVTAVSHDGDDSPKPIKKDFGSFDEWLAAFTPSTTDPARVPTPPEKDIASQLSLSKTEDKNSYVEVVVKGLKKKQIFKGSDGEVIIMRKDAYVHDLIQALAERGYQDVCGFDDGHQLISPSSSMRQGLRVRITSKESSYVMADGLAINLDEPFETFYDNFVRSAYGKTPQSKLSTAIDPITSTITVSSGSTDTLSLHVAINRTLRVPEDQSVYSLPMLFSPFPLIDVRNCGANMPVAMSQKGGILIPAFQREAICFSFSTATTTKATDSKFAIRVMSGTVNTITGEVAKPTAVPSDRQSHVVFPGQARLDGFAASPGLVKQFVSMPLGSGYTAEGQRTGKEAFGGFQLIIAPPFEEQGIFEDVADQSSTPRQQGLPDGDWIGMQGKTVDCVIEKLDPLPMTHPFTNTWLFSRDPKLRSLKLFEIAHFADAEPSGHPTATIDVVLPIKVVLRVSCHGPGTNRVHCGNAAQTWSNRVSEVSHTNIDLQLSPMLLVRDVAALLIKSFGCDRIELYNAGTPLPVDDTTTEELIIDFLPLNDTIDCHVIHYPQLRYKPYSADTANFSAPGSLAAQQAVSAASHANQMYCPGQSRPTWNLGLRPGLIDFDLPSTDSSRPYKSKPKQQWDMGIAAGGQVRQTIEEDTNPRRWNWGRACFVNIQILNAIVFESMTGLPAPICPISFKDYVKARLPFFHVIGTTSIDGGEILSNLKTVSDLNQQRGITMQNSISEDLSPVGCVICEVNLTDSIIRPCNHIFCADCITDFPRRADDKLECAACRGVVDSIIRFSAPMDITKAAANNSSDRSRSTSVISSSVGEDLIDEESLSADEALRIEPLRSSRSEPVDRTTNTTLRSSVTNIQLNDSPVHVAAYYGDDMELKRLLEEGANANLRVETNRDSLNQSSEILGGTPMHMAARNGHANATYILWEHGGHLTASGGQHSYQPLHEACKHGHNAAALVLLALGADVEALVKSSSGAECLTPLQVAAKHGQLSTIKALLFKGARKDWEMVSGNNGTAAARLSARLSSSSLHLAASHGHEHVAEHLMLVGAPVDLLRPVTKRTPLMWAAEHNQAGMIRRLVRSGANVNAQDSRGMTALHLAEQADALDALKALLESGIDATVRDSQGLTPLDRAYQSGHENCSQQLFEFQTLAKMDVSVVVKPSPSEADISDNENTEFDSDTSYQKRRSWRDRHKRRGVYVYEGEFWERGQFRPPYPTD